MTGEPEPDAAPPANPEDPPAPAEAPPAPPAEAAPAEAAPAEAAPAEAAATPEEEALARAEREAAEAVATEAFGKGEVTQRVSREKVLDAISRKSTSPLAAIRAAGPIEPAPEALPVAKSETQEPKVEAAPAVAAAEAPAPEPAAEKPAPSIDPAAGAVTEKWDREAIKEKPEKPSKPTRISPPRSEEDERLVAALLFLDAPSRDGLPGAPSPFATVGGVSLLKRAAAACKLAQVPRVLLAVNAEPAMADRVKSELMEGGWDGPVEVWNGQGALPTGEKGRLLVLDASGIHDPEAVARLARWKGERAYVMVSSEGDGLRVQVEGNRVREVGSQLVPFDGVTCGAVNVPLTLWPRLSDQGALSALISLAADGLLGASVENRTFAREVGSETGLSEARQRLLERASGGPHGTLLNRLLARKLSRPITAALLPGGANPTLGTVASILVGLIGAGFLATGQPPLQIAGCVLLILSTVFDCVAFELRSFAVRPDTQGGRLDPIPHGVVTAGALLAFGQGAQVQGDPSGLVHGAIAAAGVVAATILLIVGRATSEEGRESDASRAIELLARRFLNREVAWLLLGITIAAYVTRLAAPPEAAPPHEVLDYGVLGLAALTNSFWVGLLFLTALRPPKK